MKIRCIKLTISYDGTDFAGWQKQPDRRSVQWEIEKALSSMHGRPIHVTGAGRTDSGVHAAGQVAHFYTDIATIDAPRFQLALNKLMPRDVRIVQAEQVDDDFHARYDARLRRYKYYVRAGQFSFPHLDRFAWRVHHEPDLARLNRMAACLRGEIDCTSFSSAKDPNENRFRYLHHAVFYREGDAIVFDVAANAFLWHMVRSLVGTLVNLDREGAPLDSLIRILESGDRKKAGATAPASGLFLWNVDYYDSPTRRARSPHQSSEHSITQGFREKDGQRLVPGLGYIEEPQE